MKIIRTLVIVSQIVIGLTFIFSGFVKAVDPMGTMIKIQEYFIAFNMDWLNSFSLIFAIILCSYEFPLGVAILLGSKGKPMSWLLLIIMAGFTVLTFILALTNPVSDCGCFGDAIKLSNWETFYKNLVLMFFTLILFIYRNKIIPFHKLFSNWGSVIVSSIFILFISIYCYMYLPIIDFLPFKKGNDIVEQMTIPEGKSGDVYETILVYKNKESGKTQEFDIDNIPMDDKWEWVETQNKIVKKGYKPPLTDFILSDSAGNESGQKFLNKSGYKLLVIYHSLDVKNLRNQEKINQLTKRLTEDGVVSVWGVTSSSAEYIKNFREKYNAVLPMYHADIVLLEMMIRSNPGLMLVKDSKVIMKWPSRKIPDYDQFNKILFN